MSPTSDEARVVRFWLAAEMFSPPQIPKRDIRRHVVDVRPGEPMPWEPGSPLSRLPVRQDQVWRHEVFGGVYDLRQVRDALISLYGEDMDLEQQEPVSGQSAIFACSVDADGVLVDESAVLSACASALGRARARHRSGDTWLDDFAQDAAYYGDELGKLAGLSHAGAVRLLSATIRAAVPAAVQGGVGAAVTGALTPVSGPVVAAAAGAMAGSAAGTVTGALTGDTSSDAPTSGAAPTGDTALARLDLQPLTGAELARFTQQLSSRLGVTEDLKPRLIRVHSYLVSVTKTNDATESSFLNSFFMADLGQVVKAVSAGDIGHGLAAYLMDEGKITMADRVDVRQDPLVLRSLGTPEHIPLGRWIADTDRALALSQQFAVNRIIDQLGAGTGVFAVNGPPGTGKTTMLRDLIAAVVVQRALRLAEMTTPDDAFRGRRTYSWRLDKWSHTIVAPCPDVTGFEMVVASSNNGAVENVTEEIPGPKGIGAQWLEAASRLDYFSATAQVVWGRDAWGMIAAKLGNRRNRSDLVQAFWWGNATTGEAPRSPTPAPVDPSAEEPPADGMMRVLQRLEVATVHWPTAVAAFRRAEQKVRALAAERQKVAAAIGRLPALTREIEPLEARVHASEKTCAEFRSKQEQLGGLVRVADAQSQVARDRYELHHRLKPGLIASLSTRFRAGREWHAADQERRAEYLAAAKKAADLRQVADDTAAQVLAAMQERDQSRRARNEASAELVRLNDLVRNARQQWGDHIPEDAEYAAASSETAVQQRERSTPWADAEFAAARTELFLAALRLHKAFITAEARTIRRNLSALMDVLDGKGRPRPQALLAAWQTLFLVVPVVSSTFASIGRLFAGLGSESLGWLFIDEAGQAAPQQAVGAIWRARRAVVVGDPLQLEPVVTLPWGGQQALLHQFRVAGDWAPGRTSVQQVADRLAQYGTDLPGGLPDSSDRVWIGSPLRVHRRCDEPMFGICNQIAYDGLMVYGTPRRDAFHGANIWYDVEGTECRGHWVTAEGKALQEILTGLKNAAIPADEIRVLSPFRQVGEEARKLHQEIFPEVGQQQRKQWVGTVHTMQGKEADVVVLVLGTHPDQVSARRWAAARPNLLNVAVSRARRRLYVVGNRNSWCSLNYFSTLAANLRPYRQGGS
jgi:AAA domain